jgi:hypothetical protein
MRGHTVTGDIGREQDPKIVDKNRLNSSRTLDDHSNHKRHYKGEGRSLIALELFALVNPILFWLDYSIEKPDRLPLFKMVWKTLNHVIRQLP